MKKKFTKILGVGLTLSLLASFLMVAAPASAVPLSWTEVTVPSEVNNQLTAGQDVTDVTAVGQTVYAAAGTANITYKSTNTGASFAELSTAKGTTQFPDHEVRMVAAAPDNADIVAIVTNDGTDDQVYYSDTAGSVWTDLNFDDYGDVINDIDISMADARGIRYIACAGDDGSDAQVWTLKLSTGEVWKNRVLQADQVNPCAKFASDQAKAMAVKWSPNFDTDMILTVVTDNTGDHAYFQVFWYDLPYNQWNSDVTEYDDYGTGIVIDPEGSITGDLDAASIALSPEYLGIDEDTRIAFVGYAYDSGDKGGVFRLIDSNQDEEVMTWMGGSADGIKSLAYDGARLYAGAYEAARVYVTDDPMDTRPKFARTNTYKQPGGTGQTVVVLAGDSVVAGTSGDDCAFSVSVDNGESFNDLSLINTSLTNITDVEPAADESKVYMVSDNGTDRVSVWQRTGRTWKRVLTITEGSGYIARVSPEDASVIYIADYDGTDVYYSSDAGEAMWKKRPCQKLNDGIVDIIVESNSVVYAIDDNECSKTINSGASWSIAVSLDLEGQAVMMSQATNGDLFVGGNGGYASFSGDGGATWTQFIKQVGDAPGNVHIVPDADYETNKIIYAATDGGSMPWLLSQGPGIYQQTPPQGLSAGWNTYGMGLTWAENITGLVQYKGVLYAVRTDTVGGDSYLERALDPAADPSHYAYPNKSSGEVYNVGPRPLKASGTNRVWAINSAGSPQNELFELEDVIATVGPTLVEPADGISVPVNPASGRAFDLSFTMKRPNYMVDGIEIQIATNADFPGAIYTLGGVGHPEGKWIPTSEGDTVTRVIGPSGITGDEGEWATFMPDTTYYWRTRVAYDGPFYSPWSEVRSFTVASAPEPITVEIPPTPAITLPTPEVTVTIPPAPEVKVELPAPIVNIPPSPPPVEPIPQWALILIIVIGAVLLIAVIALIVRTRRVT